MNKIDLLNNFSESEEIPKFLICIDSKDQEYILNTSIYPCLIKINGIMDKDGEEDEENEEEYEFAGVDAEDIDDVELDIQESFVFDVEVFKLTDKGIRPIGRERSLDSIQNIIRQAINYYVEEEKK